MPPALTTALRCVCVCVNAGHREALASKLSAAEATVTSLRQALEIEQTQVQTLHQQLANFEDANRTVSTPAAFMPCDRGWLYCVVVSSRHNRLVDGQM